ncbi:MAG TPA: hypothetical protein VF104_11810, partial [Burkholderiales bacterium]
VADFVSGTDKLQFSQAAIRVGDGDTSVEGGVVVTGPGSFAPTAELVIVTADVLAINTANAAAAIGSASGAYTLNASAIFAVDNGAQTGLFHFVSSGTDAVVSAGELTLLATLNSTPATALADYLFVA